METDGGNIRGLQFVLSEMETEVSVRRWDLSVSASVRTAEIQNYITKGRI